MRDRRFRTSVLSSVLIAVLLDSVLTSCGIRDFGDGNSVLAWMYTKTGHLGVVLYFVCVGLLYLLLIWTSSRRVAIALSFVAWSVHLLGAATWVLGPFGDSLGGWRYALASIALLVSALPLTSVFGHTLTRSSPERTDRERPIESDQAVPDYQTTSESRHDNSGTPTAFELPGHSGRSVPRRPSMSCRPRVWLLLFLSTSYTVDAGVTALYLIGHSTDRPILDWFDFQFGVAGTLLYFGCIGIIYWHSIVNLHPRLAVLMTVLVWFLHLYDVSTYVHIPWSPIGPGTALLLITAFAAASSLLLERAFASQANRNITSA